MSVHAKLAILEMELIVLVSILIDWYEGFKVEFLVLVSLHLTNLSLATNIFSS